MERATLDLETANSGLERALERSWFQNLITSLIVFNAVILGVLTYRQELPGSFVSTLEMLDHAITIIFAVEISLKLIVYRFQFFKSGWNWFDFIVVGLSLIPGSGAFSVMRALRVLRVLRLLRVVPMMKRITEALLKALPGMGAIFAVLALFTYVGAVMATNMFGNTDDEDVLLLFGDLPRSAYSLFQVMTMDGWRFEVVEKVIDDGHPYAWVFFLIFIFIASFAILNLFIALIVEALQREQQAVQAELMAEIEGEIEETASETHADMTDILRAINSLREEVSDLKSKLP